MKWQLVLAILPTCEWWARWSFIQSVVTVSMNSILNETIQLIAHSVNNSLRVMNVERQDLERALKLFSTKSIFIIQNLYLVKAFSSFSILKILCCIETWKMW